jgi:hypothetical protein
MMSQARSYQDLMADMGNARKVREEYLHDADLIRETRCRVEQERQNAECYGGTFTTHDYVTSVLGHFADALQDQVRAR